MAYKALYRTYRPSTFKEVAGQKHIVKTLQNALLTNKLAHAYLFCGPRGTGKTSMAKLLAKALNCEEGIGHQCNQCSNCQAIINGSHPDVIEIDAASNNGVDEVRELIDKVKYSPIKGRYKVYIIDEVHMMTSGAFNALLKTLEEPPAHVIFILATTEPHKILPTIISRCQRYDFTKVDSVDLRNRLIEVLNSENVTFEEDAVNMVVSLADGGVRDALSILDQILAYSGNILRISDVQDLFGLASIEEKTTFLKNIASKNTKDSLKMMDEFIKHGIDIKRLTSDLLDILKDIVIYQSTEDSSLLLKLDSEIAISLSNIFTTSTCLDLIDVLLEALNDFKYASNINSLFQIMILKLCSIRTRKETTQYSSSNEEKTEVIEEKQAPITKPEINVEESVEKQKTVTENTMEENTPSFSNDNLNVGSLQREGEKNGLSDETIVQIMTTGDKSLKLSLLEKWDNLQVYKLHPTLGAYAEVLLEGRPYVMNKRVLLLEFQFSHLSEAVNIIANQKGIQELVKQIYGDYIPIYGLPRSESVRLQKLFLDLRQISKLPKTNIEQINITIKGEN